MKNMIIRMPIEKILKNIFLGKMFFFFLEFAQNLHSVTHHTNTQ